MLGSTLQGSSCPSNTRPLRGVLGWGTQQIPRNGPLLWATLRFRNHRFEISTLTRPQIFYYGSMVIWYSDRIRYQCPAFDSFAEELGKLGRVHHWSTIGKPSLARLPAAVREMSRDADPFEKIEGLEKTAKIEIKTHQENWTRPISSIFLFYFIFNCDLKLKNNSFINNVYPFTFSESLDFMCWSSVFLNSNPNGS